MSDILTELDQMIADTPVDHYVCAPLKRSVVAAAADEIRRLRALVAELAMLGQPPTATRKKRQP